MLERIESQRQELKRQMRVLANNDRMRREFTANVTHELKTPLTTISGYAELIENGLVASEDDQRDFGRRIHSEATRLAALVNDILTLSSLDEAEPMATPEVSKSVLGCLRARLTYHVSWMRSVSAWSRLQMRAALPWDKIRAR